MKIIKKKTYVKIEIPGGKAYRAMLGNSTSRRSFRTATLAEEYAKAWHDRYISLQIAEIRMDKEYEKS